VQRLLGALGEVGHVGVGERRQLGREHHDQPAPWPGLRQRVGLSRREARGERRPLRAHHQRRRRTAEREQGERARDAERRG
jgi:hypothetical protein